MLILNPNAFRNVATRLLFRVDAETAHALSAAALKQRWLWQSLEPLLSVRDSSLETDLAGLKLRSPVGLAAGFDKNCEMLPSLAALGFGYVTGGTITRQPQPGNPPPRVFRYERDDSLINAMGFPNLGVMHAARHLRRDRERVGAPVVVSVSGETPDTIASCHRAVEPMCDAVEVNVSSPNTRGLRVFQQPDALSDLLDKLNEGRSKPLFVKLPPYPPARASDDGAREQALALAAVCERMGADAVTIANTWPARDSRLAVGAGGVSGRVVFEDTLRMVAEVRSEVGSRMAINACGGIFSGADAYAALQAGATTVQLYTGMVYRGPGIARAINRGLLAMRN